MAKFFGKVYYGDTVESEDGSGVWNIELIPKEYFGDVTKNYRRLENGDKVNDDIIFNNVISIVADAYAFENFAKIRCVEWMGSKWRISTIEIAPPRLILTLGGLYNE